MLELEKAIKVLESKIDTLQTRIELAEQNPFTREIYIKEMRNEKEVLETVLEGLERRKKIIRELEYRINKIEHK